MKKAILFLFALISIIASAQAPQRFNKVIVTGDITSPKFIRTGSTVDSVLLGNGSVRAVTSIKTDTSHLSARINTKQPIGTYSTDIHSNISALNSVSGTNTGDETLTSLKTKLGITTLSGSNTGDQTTITGNSGSATKLQTSRTINGVAFDGTQNITVNAVDATARVATSLLGAANGVATLDNNGIILTTQLPSYVDDVIEASNLASFPVTGETGKIYVAKDTNKTYRWSGSVYIYITSGAVDAVNGYTGVISLSKSDIGLGNVDNTTDLNKPISTATQSALAGKQASGTYSTDIHGNISALNSVSGSNTGDETLTSIKTKLGAANASNSGYITVSDWNLFNNKLGSIGYGNIIGALGYTPYDQTNPMGYITSAGNSASVGGLTPEMIVSGSYNGAYNSISNTDMNLVFKAGFYNGSSITNAPNASDFGFINIPNWAADNTNSRYNLQIGSNIGGNLVFRSTNISGAGSWKTILNDGNYGTYAIQNNPASAQSGSIWINGTSGSDVIKVDKSTGGNLSLFANGVYQNQIDCDVSGNMHIWSKNGAQALTINSAGAATFSSTIRATERVSAYSGNKSIYLYNDGTDIKLDAYEFVTNNPLPVQIGGNGGNIYLSGKVGIGTKNPSSALTLGGDRPTNPNTGAEIDYPGNSITFANTDYVVGGIKMVQPNGYYVNAADMVLSTAFGTLDEKVRIKNNGNVGIGYSTGTEITNNKLSINGGVYASSFKTPTGTSSQFLKADGSVDSSISSGTFYSTTSNLVGISAAVVPAFFYQKIGSVISFNADGAVTTTQVGDINFRMTIPSGYTVLNLSVNAYDNSNNVIYARASVLSPGVLNINILSKVSGSTMGLIITGMGY